MRQNYEGKQLPQDIPDTAAGCVLTIGSQTSVQNRHFEKPLRKFLESRTMSIQDQNKILFSLPSDHPARRFLEEFIDCRELCVAREVGMPDNPPIEQAWDSQIEGRRYAFSSFAYKYLAFDVVLDGWLTNAPDMTDSERDVLDMLPKVRSLLGECHAAAIKERNVAILPLLEKVKNLLDLWEQCITSRLVEIS